MQPEMRKTRLGFAESFRRCAVVGRWGTGYLPARKLSRSVKISEYAQAGLPLAAQAARRHCH
jgi:hypothetical protein